MEIMKYLNIQTLRQTVKFIDDTTTIPSTDARVSNWFTSCPDGFKGEWIGDTYTFVEIPRINQDGTRNSLGFEAKLLNKDADDNYYEFYNVDGTPDLVKIDAEATKKAQEAINTEALAYLASTDWYVIRLQETGVAVPQDILDARASARLSIAVV